MLHFQLKKQQDNFLKLLFATLFITCLPLGLFADNGFLRFKVNKEIGETIGIYIYTLEGEKNAKVNIEGAENIDLFKSGKRIDYTLTSKEVVISGDIENIYIDNDNVVEVEAKNFNTLRKIECQENQITKLDITGCPNIYWIDCSKNLLTELKLADIEKLQTLLCEHNKITSIDIINCPSLWSFGIEDNMLDENEMDKLVSSLCDRSEKNDYGCLYVENREEEGLTHNYFNKVQSAILEGKKWKAFETVNGEWARFYGENVSDAVILYAKKYIDDEMTLNISAQGNIKFYGIKNTDAFINGQNVNYILSSPVVIVRGNINTINVNNMDITLLDVSSNAYIENINCSDNQIQVLNITGCEKLTSLNCSSNEINEIDFSGASKIKEIDCSNNAIYSLNLSDMTALTKVNCSNNILATLKINNCNLLNSLNCSANQLRWNAFNSITKDVADFSASNNKANIYVLDKTIGNDERNRCDSEQVDRLVKKGWNVFCYEKSDWTDYKGETVMGPSKITIKNNLNPGDMVIYGFLSMGEIKITGVEEPEKAINGSVEFYTLTDKTVTIEGDITLLDCSWNDQTSLVFDNCKMFETLNCYDNVLTSIKFNNCDNLREIHCYNNKLDDKAMTEMIECLPLRKAEDDAMIDVYDDVSNYDENICNESHVAAFYQKNWTPYYHQKDTYDWVEYENTLVGIEKTTLNGSELSLNVNRNIISISGLPASTAVRVYALDGSCILETISDSEGHANISTGRMSQDTYLIKAGSCSAKLAIK